MRIEGHFNEQSFTEAPINRGVLLNSPNEAKQGFHKTRPMQVNADELPARFTHFKMKLKGNGYAWLRLDRALNEGELIMFARAFGAPIEEPPEQLGAVKENCILEIKEAFLSSQREQNNIFSRCMIPARSHGFDGGDRHAFKVFHCVSASSDDSPTILFPMNEIGKALGNQDRKILQRTFMQDGSAPVLERINGRWVFNFSDNNEAELDWKFTAENNHYDEGHVNQAINNLLYAIYSMPPHVIEWQPNDLLIFDTTKVFQARPVSSRTSPDFTRHLDRVVIAAPDQGTFDWLSGFDA